MALDGCYILIQFAPTDDSSNERRQERPKVLRQQTSILSGISESRDKVLWFFNDMRVFIVLELITDFFTGVLGHYYWQMMTSIQKELQISGTKMGFLMTAWDIGRLPVLPLLSFFGGRAHIPRVLGFMQVLRAVGIALLVLPHFLFGGNIIALLKAAASEVAITAEEQTMLVGNYTYMTKICHPPQPAAPLEIDEIIRNSDYSYAMFIAAYIVFGISFSAPGTLGMMYIDNNFDKSKLPMLIGLKLAVFGIAPFCASTLATWLSRLYVDLTEPNITFVDPKWISAWWLGLVISMVPPIVIGPLFCLFPRRMRKRGTFNLNIPCLTMLIAKKTAASVKMEEEKPKKIKTQLSVQEKRYKEERAKEEAARIEDEHKKNADEAYTIKQFPVLLRSLLKNRVFMVLVLYNILQDITWSGWGTYQMKYYEQVFRVPVFKITAATAVADLIVRPIGSLLGGVVVARLRPTFARATLLMIATIVVWCGIGVGRMMITCGDCTYAGLNYTGPVQLMGECNADCECNRRAYSPVCDNGLTYFSPCHAGCELGNITMKDGIIQPELKEFYDCNCTQSGLATPGRCEGECDLFYLYAALRAISLLVWMLTGSATQLMIIRTLSFRDKAFGLGINMCVGALLGSIPSGPLIGMIMDSTCLVWQYLSGRRGTCWVHDATQLRYRLYAWTLILMTLQSFVLLVVYFMAKRRNLKLFDEDDPMVLDKKNAEIEVGEPKESGMSGELNSAYSMDSGIQENTKL